MKRIILFFNLVLFSMVLIAQDTNYDGPAKVTVKAFWDAAEKLEKSIAGGGSSLDADNFMGLRRKIDDTKRKDAAYNTGTMESKIQSLASAISALKNSKDKAIQENNNKEDAAQQVKKLLNELFQVSTSVSTGTLSTIEDKIGEYRKKMTTVLGMDMSNSASALANNLRYVTGHFKNYEKELLAEERSCREQVKTENAKVNYYKLVFEKAYWDAAQKIFPAETAFTKAYALASRLVEGLGTANDMEALTAKSREKKIRETKLPESAVNDPALEKMFIDVFNKTFKETRGTAFKAVVINKDWRISRNEISGIVIGRGMTGAVAYKGANGKCYLEVFEVYEDYVGNTFQSPKVGYESYSGVELLCENVK